MQAYSGVYLKSVTAAIIQALLDADVIILLRYALDEKSDLVIAAAINTWHALCIPHTDLVGEVTWPD